MEKLPNYDDIYSVRGKGRNKADRLLFTKGGGEVSILSVADNHDYDTALKEANSKSKIKVSGLFHQSLCNGVRSFSLTVKIIKNNG